MKNQNEVPLKVLKEKLTPEEMAERNRLIALEKREFAREKHESFTPNYKRLDAENLED